MMLSVDSSAAPVARTNSSARRAKASSILLNSSSNLLPRAFPSVSMPETIRSRSSPRPHLDSIKRGYRIGKPGRL